jgi:hypothetical protein
MDGYTQYLKGFGAVIGRRWLVASGWKGKGFERKGREGREGLKIRFAKYYKDKGSNAMYAMFQRNVRDGFL